MSDDANDRANGNRAQRAHRGSADAAAQASAQVGEPGRRCAGLIIRRSWVRSTPAPLTGFAGFASVVAGASGFAVGGPGSLADPLASAWSTACAGRRWYW